MLIERLALPFLDRLRRSPYGGAWLDGATFGVELGGERWAAGLTRVQPYAEEPVDAWLRAAPADLEAMLAGRAPAGEVGWRLGESEVVAPRVKQARAVLALAALGWCGPWPDPGADRELVALTRRAVLDLALGPADEVRPLFAAGAPSDLAAVALRFTDGARRRWCTLGLSDASGAPELWTDVDPRLLRVAVLHWFEAGSWPRSLQTDRGELRFEAAPLPLPHALAALVRVRA